MTSKQDWEKDWQAFYSFYGDIGRSEEDIKDFIRSLLASQEIELRRELAGDVDSLRGSVEELTKYMETALLGSNVVFKEGFNRGVKEAVKLIKGEVK